MSRRLRRAAAVAATLVACVGGGTASAQAATPTLAGAGQCMRDRLPARPTVHAMRGGGLLVYWSQPPAGAMTTHEALPTSHEAQVWLHVEGAPASSTAHEVAWSGWRPVAASGGERLGWIRSDTASDATGAQSGLDAALVDPVVGGCLAGSSGPAAAGSLSAGRWRRASGARREVDWFWLDAQLAVARARAGVDDLEDPHGQPCVGPAASSIEGLRQAARLLELVADDRLAATTHAELEAAKRASDCEHPIRHVPGYLGAAQARASIDRIDAALTRFAGAPSRADQAAMLRARIASLPEDGGEVGGNEAASELDAFVATIDQLRRDVRTSSLPDSTRAQLDRDLAPVRAHAADLTSVPTPAALRRVDRAVAVLSDRYGAAIGRDRRRLAEALVAREALVAMVDDHPGNALAFTGPYPPDFPHPSAELRRGIRLFARVNRDADRGLDATPPPQPLLTAVRVRLLAAVTLFLDDARSQ